MVSKVRAFGLFGGAIAALAALAVLETGGAIDEDEIRSLVKLPDRGVGTRPRPSSHPTPASGLVASGLSHRTPPPMVYLQDRPDIQAAYDAEAQPGDFVTPPAVSVEH